MAWYNTLGKKVVNTVGGNRYGKAAAPIVGKAIRNAPGNVGLGVAANLENPNMNIWGAANPSRTSAPAQQQQQDMGTQSLYGDGSGGGGGSSYSDPYAEAYGGQRQAVQDKLSSLINAYNSLTGSAERSYATKANELRSQYGNQRQKFGDVLQQTANTLTGAYQAKGISDSSFAANAQNSAINNYNTDINNVNQAEQSGLGQLGQALQSARGQYEAAKSTYQDYLNNLGNYGGQDLSNIMGSAETGLQNVAQAQAGMGSQADYINAINSIAPKQLSPTALQSQLQTLQNSGTDNYTKSVIAKGLINQATEGNPEQQTYWSDYFKSLGTTGKA